MLTIKILSTINSLKKKLFRQDTIYNSFRDEGEHSCVGIMIFATVPCLRA